MKENRLLYLSISVMFLSLLIFQLIHFIQIDRVYISAFDYQSLWYVPYTLGLLIAATLIIYVLPVLFVVEVLLLFIIFRRTYHFILIRKSLKNFYVSFIQIESVFFKLQVIRC